MKLIKAFDENDCYKNVISPLSLDVEEVCFLYRHKVNKKLINAVDHVIKKHKNIKTSFIKIKDENDVDDIMNENKNITVDVSGVRYVSLLIFDRALKNGHPIIFYDGEEYTIKSYKDHKVVADIIFKLSIEDVVELGGGEIKDHMHKPPKSDDEITNQIIIKTVEASFDRYITFTNFVSRINNLVCRLDSYDGKHYRIRKDSAKKLESDEVFRFYEKVGLLKLEENSIVFPTYKIKQMFSISGSFLESYLYMKLKESNYFDDVMMSAVIDFLGDDKRYPIRCEIDALVMKDNHLLFVSCKSNKIKTEDLNEIKVHNVTFGNVESHAVVCTIDDLNVSSPSIYSKAKELDIAVIDVTAFKNGTVADEMLNIIKDTYNYEPISHKKYKH